MNMVGKIFVVLVFSTCLVLMSMSMMFGVGPTNWRRVIDNDSPEAPGYKQRMQVVQVDNENLRSINDDWGEQLKAEKVNRENLVKELEQQRTKNQEEIAKLQQEVEDARDTMRTKIAHIQSEQDQANQLARENITIRDHIQRLIVARDEAVKLNIQLTDQISETGRRIDAMKKRDEVLAAELGRNKLVLDFLDLKPEVAYYGNLIPPMGLVGRVLAVAPERKMVEISIGSDDGVRVGHRFEVLTADASGYVGRVVVSNLFRDKAVCENIEGFENGVYEKGNRVVPLMGDYGRLSRKND